jgi:hypothetical protein
VHADAHPRGPSARTGAAREPVFDRSGRTRRLFSTQFGRHYRGPASLADRSSQGR